ncbi:hypothetical protein BH10ACI1_BH10ACI1_19640 [soil metagenome]
MKLCPKCRSFYDDPLLVFCQKDGVPLIVLTQRDELWTESIEALEKSHQAELKMKRIRKFKKFAKILSVILMTMMIVSVVAMNIYIYVPRQKVEITENIPPTPTPDPVFSPQTEPTAVIEKTPAITPTAAPTKTVSPTPSPTATPTLQPSPTATVKPVCSQAEKAEILASIRANYFERWQTEILKEETAFRRLFSNENQTVFEETQVKLNFAKEQINIIPNPECTEAKAVAYYSWAVNPVNGVPAKVKVLSGSKGFHCRKTGNIWKCN